MSTIIDKRNMNKKRLAGSRAKFIKRYKQYIREKVEDHFNNTNIKDIGDNVNVGVGKKSIKEDRLIYDKSNSDYKGIYSGNKKYNKGDKQNFTPSYSSKGKRASNGQDIGEDEFSFILTKKEFMDILFDDMELPNFVKKNFKSSLSTKKVTGGYIKEGLPSRMCIKKTMEMAMARRLIAKSSGKKARFIDDTDLRFRNFSLETNPTSHAVVFFIMDISGSMSEDHKSTAKKFFLLLYLFLTRNYKSVEVRFISHTIVAKEVTEEEFFYSRETGGTMVSPAIALANKIIDAEYDINNTNIYVAQASDGDNWTDDYKNLGGEIENLLPKIQYMAYIEIDNSYPEEGVHAYYNKDFSGEKKLNAAIIEDIGEVYSVLKNLFKK